MTNKTKLAKITATAITGTALTLSALTIFTGTNTIDLSKNTIIEFAEKINIYESNETKLTNKINELKIERDSLISELSRFEGIQLDEMNEKIETLENQISEYETELTNAEINAETLAGRILDLEAEILKANNKTSELQTILDRNVVDSSPLTEQELAEITEVPIIDFSYAWKSAAKEIIPGITISTISSYEYIKVENNTNKEIVVKYNTATRPSTVNPGSDYYDSSSSTKNIVIEDHEGTVIANINIIR